MIDVLGPGHVAGEQAGVPSPVTVRALRPCRLSPVSGRAAADLLTTRAHRAAALAAELAWLGVRHAYRAAAGGPRRAVRAPGRRGGTLILLPLTQDEVAALAGTTRESANRALRAMIADGEIRVAARGRYVVRTRFQRVGEGG